MTIISNTPVDVDGYLLCHCYVVSEDPKDQFVI